MTVVIHGAFPLAVQVRPRTFDSPSPVDIDPDARWREVCAEFLRACFDGATRGRLRTLARNVLAARDLKACR